MDIITLSRWQFAITTIYHFFFVPMTLGLSIFVAIMQTKYYRTNDPNYNRLARFYGKIFVIFFAMGVVTGIVQEFHFGMNWSEYSRFMGDIFGAPLALEALMAFFLESIFLGVWLFGEGKVSKKVHLLAIWLVAIGSNISAFWILVANSFMQYPVGYGLEGGRAVMTSFGALLSNPYVVGEFSHTFGAGLATAGVVVVVISAYKILRDETLETFNKGLKWGLVYGLVGILFSFGTGHLHAQFIGRNVPMKIAAVEALWETADPAPFSIVADIDQENEKNKSAIEIPAVLSILIYDKPAGEVQGLKELQAQYVEKYGSGDYIPDVTMLFWCFRIMIGSGMLILLGLLAGLYISLKKTTSQHRFILKCLMWLLPLPYISNSTGWIVAEMGRQPWIVYGLQKVSDAVSPNLTSGEVMTTIIGFTLLYAALAIVAVFIAVRFIREDVSKLDNKGGEA